MKICILNLANNVTDFKTTPSGETIHIKNVFIKLGYEVDIISKSDTDRTIAFENVNDINIYQAMIIINGALNFFGGKENPVIINNYKLMSKFKGKIFYFLTDLSLPYRSLWNAIKNRGWDIKEEDVSITNKMTIVSQAKNLNMVKELHEGIPEIGDVVYFPLERYKLVNEFEIAEPTIKFSDVIYGGSYRSGRREAKMNKYLFDTEYDVEIFGNASLDQFKLPYTKAPTFTGKVAQTEFVSKTSTGIASIIIGDPNYNNNMITLRVWETMLSDAICFIDQDFDPNYEILQNQYFYVSTKEELERKIKEIKNDEKLRHQLLDYQHNKIHDHFNRESYLLAMHELIHGPESQEKLEEYYDENQDN
jgi:hypothetical protein